MASGAIWMVLATLVQRSLGLMSTLVLARVLVPHDFGIVAMAMSFVALLEMLGAFGFDVALIQRQTTDRRYWDTVWTLEVILGICVAALMIAGATAGRCVLQGTCTGGRPVRARDRFGRAGLSEHRPGRLSH